MGIAPVIMPMLTDKSSMATIEDSTPVNSRLLKKALSPPITIKSFFKPSCKASDPEGSAGKAEGSSNTCSFSLVDKSVDVDQLDKSAETTCESGSINKAETTSHLSMTSTMSKLRNNGKNKSKGETKLKRAAESILTRPDSVKRCKKQGNILNSLQNSNWQRRECPICKTIFSPTANNQEINDHMDNCLIE